MFARSTPLATAAITLVAACGAVSTRDLSPTNSAYEGSLDADRARLELNRDLSFRLWLHLHDRQTAQDNVHDYDFLWTEWNVTGHWVAAPESQTQASRAVRRDDGAEYILLHVAKAEAECAPVAGGPGDPEMVPQPLFPPNAVLRAALVDDQAVLLVHWLPFGLRRIE